MYRRSVVIAALVLLGCSSEKPTAPAATASPQNRALVEYEMQRKCSADAKSFFDYIEGSSPSKGTDELSNHYNGKLNRCFALITHGITNVNDIYTKTLFDAVERKQYASYAWASRKDKKYWEVPPLECKTLDAQCSSEEQFDAWVKPYMSD
jgi:hypothetical protein